LNPSDSDCDDALSSNTSRLNCLVQAFAADQHRKWFMLELIAKAAVGRTPTGNCKILTPVAEASL